MQATATAPNAHAWITRDAMLTDLPALATMGASFLAWSPYRGLPGINTSGIGAALLGIAEGGGFLRVAEVDGRVVGMLVGVFCDLWFAPHVRVASELAWWLEPEHRKGGIGKRMVLDFEAWARACSASVVAMSALEVEGDDGKADALIELLGYRRVERTYVKEVR